MDFIFVKKDFTMLDSKGVKSFLTTMKIHFYTQNECHSSELYPIILRSAFRDQAVKRCNICSN